MRVAIYLRQSQDRNGDQLGIDRQREDCQRLVAARGWTVTAEFVDNDVSATSRKARPQFNAMMARVDTGEFDIIVSRHLDRLLRKLSDFVSIREACQKSGVEIVTGDGIDTSSDGGRLFAGMMAVVAQGEVDRKSTRQRSAAKQAAEQGRWVGGRRPFGYEDDGVTIRESEAALVKQGFTDVLAGESVAEIARRWDASGFPTAQGNPWSRCAVRDVLTNPRYAGLRRYRPAEDRRAIRQNPELGITGKAEWPGIVDEPTWRAAARILCDPKRYRPAIGGKGLLTGVAECGVCGEKLHRGGASHGVPMYRCRSGKHVSRKAAPIDEYVTAVALAALSGPRAADLWAAELPDATELMTEADVLRQRRDHFAEDYADGVMTREQFRDANARVLSRLDSIESQIASAGQSSPLAIVASEDVESTWAELSVAQRRGIISALMVPVVELVGAGVRTFRPESVTIRWNVGE
ncbi:MULTISPECIES: recombinase family protein [unclassified Mycolicibacterium]|uniref:recombinase family protein n=1 Tax=unclassified Mycolicibacterium TaxID=2636767 RepID=UPI0012DF341F|nr:MULTISPECIES: recombinase family protein [unclassified Mycolicibacterium]MUL80514.1 recombinase family protein [Mycolicibacterium sp. CBMA 329]MUL86281.1 recombinase family protein [Mycolicibacterium sp. CBMA 331]MUM01058.1 recombinase family protein [Mycolicibacterium sp. CBMA 334]MUM24951.1 recombinase family protein [Mycolicibacterium sp. CBMA 295]MUM36577.1 recombinase family protein [Mycolicibacterium sp. CBMA 247]